MTKYGIGYRENGIYKTRGFKYQDQYERAYARLSKKSNVEILVTVVDWVRYDH